MHALELERAASPPAHRHGEPDSCCAEMRQWHRHAGKIDWLFRLSMPPCIGVTWLHMMFLVGYSYSYEYLAAFLVMFVLVFAWAGWAELQQTCVMCGVGCAPCAQCLCSGLASCGSFMCRCCRRGKPSDGAT